MLLRFLGRLWLYLGLWPEARKLGNVGRHDERYGHSDLTIVNEDSS